MSKSKKQPKPSPDSETEPTTNDTYEVHLGTDEDLERDFGSGGLVIGLRVMPSDSTPSTPANPSE
jgi:hypothetical protein